MPGPKRMWIVMPYVLGTVLLAANLILLKEVSHLKQSASARIQSWHPIPGKQVSSISGADINKEPFTMSFGQREGKTLLLAFSPKCNVCDLNWPAWRRIISEVHDCSIHIVFLDTSQFPVSKDYLSQHNMMDFPVFTAVDAGDLLKYNLFFTPETIVLSTRGIILRAWVGQLHEDDINDVIRIIAPLVSQQRVFHNALVRFGGQRPTCGE